MAQPTGKSAMGQRREHGEVQEQTQAQVMEAIGADKQSKKSIGKGGARPGAGRPKGSLDKGNALIREMACQALNQVGGVDYLARVAETHPGPFLSLLGKILPVQIGGDPENPLRIVWPVQPPSVER